MFLQLSILCTGEDFFESETLIFGMQNAVGSFEVHSQNGFTQLIKANKNIWCKKGSTAELSERQTTSIARP